MFYTLEAEFLALGFMGVAAVYQLAKYSYDKYRRRNRRTSSSGTSLLLSYYTDGMEQIFPLKQGKLADMDYRAVAVLGHADDPFSTALLYMVMLPFKTELHLLGIPKKSGIIQLNPSGGNSIMEPVVLEGDYPDYFSLYCEKGMQAEVRHALDPKAMLFTVDFCQSHSWEIADGYLYFLQASTPQHKDDPTFMSEDIDSFVKEIKPVVSTGIDNSDVYSQTASRLIAKVVKKKLHCPVCTTALAYEEDCLRCPEHHGILLVGSKLELVKTGQILNPLTNKFNRPNKSICPACKSLMDHVQYGNRTTFIDSCTNCPYRWLDAGELDISGKKIKLLASSKN